MRLFSDQKKLLLTTYQGSGALIGDALAEEAINQAYRKLAGCHPWSYLHRRAQITTVAPQSTGTVAFNSSTNVLTLTGATWPTWATHGILIIKSNVYAVQNILSSATVSLVATRRPQADIASGTSYVLAQIEYPLPVDFLRMEDLITVGNVWVTREIEPGSLLQTERIFYNPARPWMYMVRGSTYYPGQMAIEFAPPPDAAYTFDISYFAMPRQRTLPRPYVSGTVSVSGTAVTGTNTAFTQSMVGCRLRQGTADSIPDGEYGPTGSTSENTIASVTNATSLTLVDAGATSSNVMFMIDDPIDVERVSLDEAFCRICEYEFASLTRDDKRAEKEGDMIRALQNARARDVRTTPRKNNYSIPTFEALAYANLGGT